MIEMLLFLLLFGLGYGVMVWPIQCRYLQFFQQEEYDNRRFLEWWRERRAVEKRVTAFCLLLLALAAGAGLAKSQALGAILSGQPWPVAVGLTAMLAWLGWGNRVKEAKKPLVFTTRIKRLLGVNHAIHFGILYGGLHCMTPAQSVPSFVAFALLVVVLVFSLPLTLVLSNLVLSPFEARVQRNFLEEAKQILHQVRPRIIGITGSYGKTSIKHILDHILNTTAPTLSTPGSVNTQMGITRIIRERLKKDHAYFIVEMGAYGIGSIRRLCELTPPQAALVTAVGIAHYERFKTQEAVAEAKSELVQALPVDGLAVLNGDDPHCRAMAAKTQSHCLFYGRNPEAGELHCRLLADRLTAEGMECQMVFQEKEYTFLLPLYGNHQALNAAGAFLLACALGVPPITAIAALRHVPGINHRLVVQKDPQGITTIDDAYNSNPVGFQNALEVLEVLPGNKKILVTPGMVELGQRQEAEHAKLAPLAARACTDIYLIAAHRIPGFKEALLREGFAADRLREFPTLREARAVLQQEIQPGDVLLFENDLPDLYETRQVFSFF
ncbi:MAG: UDP-N-acetylmuramoyl-tripeptide--D-alanyl-D-alanine ligase [bacterium]|jgi:UDP-N-acetylmuramoyl-tripeptide--D-alanyl-D-alanine ligase|nr:UDP-N-acetylmuramoyl-tripeptide--D-alanyl-D-alanine ligase [bacterium]